MTLLQFLRTLLTIIGIFAACILILACSIVIGRIAGNSIYILINR